MKSRGSFPSKLLGRSRSSHFQTVVERQAVAVLGNYLGNHCYLALARGHCRSNTAVGTALQNRAEINGAERQDHVAAPIRSRPYRRDTAAIPRPDRLIIQSEAH